MDTIYALQIISIMMFGTPDSIYRVKWDFFNPQHVIWLNTIDSIISKRNIEYLKKLK